jgi:hypothetical protein
MLSGNVLPSPNLQKLTEVLLSGERREQETTTYHNPNEEQQHGGLYYIVSKWVIQGMPVKVLCCKAIKGLDDGTGDYRICEVYVVTDTFHAVANAVRQAFGESWLVASDLDIWPMPVDDSVQLQEDEF